MPTTNGNRKLLDLKRWEMVSPAPTATVAASCLTGCLHVSQQALYLTSNTTAWLYNLLEDGWCALPSPALAGTFGAGAAACAGAVSIGAATGAATLTATGGTTTTIVTNQTLARDLRGYSVHIAGGPNAGATLVIRSNTIGANATITVDAQGTAFSASTTYRLITPVWYVLGAGTLASGSFRKYDFATNTWTTLSSAAPLAATIGTDGRLVATPSWQLSGYLQFSTGTAAAGSTSTTLVTSKTWTVNQWTNYQVRIVGGTGAGQVRTISSNTATTLTVPTWTTTPDATSTFSIEGNDDFLYYMGNNAVTLYRYSISANTWTALSPTAARAAAPSTGMSAHWVANVADSDWTSEAAIRNGQRIYSFRGGAGAVLDYYDIAANTWVSGVTYSPATETFTTGTKYAIYGNFLYIHKDATGRWFRYNFATSEMDGWTTMLYPNGAALVGDTSVASVYVDGATQIPYVYMALNTSAITLRQMVI